VGNETGNVIIILYASAIRPQYAWEHRSVIVFKARKQYILRPVNAKGLGTGAKHGQKDSGSVLKHGQKRPKGLGIGAQMVQIIQIIPSNYSHWNIKW
jgi:hypothetical protein